MLVQVRADFVVVEKLLDELGLISDRLDLRSFRLGVVRQLLNLLDVLLIGRESFAQMAGHLDIFREPLERSVHAARSSVPARGRSSSPA